MLKSSRRPASLAMPCSCARRHRSSIEMPSSLAIRVALQLLPHRPHRGAPQRRAVAVAGLVPVIVEGRDHAGDLADADAPALARQPIAAARAARSLENLSPHQPLHDLLEVALRDALALGDLAALHRIGAGLIGDVDHRLERKEKLFRGLKHGASTYLCRSGLCRSGCHPHPTLPHQGGGPGTGHRAMSPPPLVGGGRGRGPSNESL